MKPNNFPFRKNLDGSEELYTQTGGLSQKFTLEATKTFITEPIDIIYSELYNKVFNGNLVAGSWYRLTDYKSVNFLNGIDIAQNNPTPSDPNFNPQEIYIGETEVLLLQAISSSEISPIAYSETYPQDIIQYNPLANKIGLALNISNGQTLPNSNIVSGLDLQWDGKNVYFNMPTGYPALFGEFFRISAAFNEKTYLINNSFYPLSNNVNIPISVNGISTNIKIENNGMKIILLDLTQQNYLDYNINTLFVEHIYALGDAYGWITKRIDTVKNIDVPFDFRGRKYRRFEVDLSSINADLGTGFYGQGDDYLGKGTTGNYQDFKCINEESYNVKIKDYNLGSKQFFDNTIFLKGLKDVEIGSNCRNNTIGSNFYSNTIGSNFYSNTIGTDFNNNTIGNSFSNNAIGNSFRNNTIGNGSYNNTIGIFFQNNTIGSDLNNNKIGNDFANNTIGNSFTNNSIGNDFTNNTIGIGFELNNIGNSFQYNNIGDLFAKNTTGQASQSNTIGNFFNNNTIGNSFNSNTIGNDFNFNTIGNIFSTNTIGNEFNNNTIGDNFNNNNMNNNFQNNNLGTGFTYNIIGDNFDSNTIANSFMGNVIENDFKTNTINNDFKGNEVQNNCTNNIIGNLFQGNILANYFASNNIGSVTLGNLFANYFQSNIIGNNFNQNVIKTTITSTNFTLATHVYGDYNCEIFKRSDTTFQLSYIDGTNTIQYAAINA